MRRSTPIRDEAPAKPSRQRQRTSRRRVILLGLLTAIVSGAAVVAGFPVLPGWARTVLAGLTAVIAGVVAALQTWRHEDPTGSGPASDHDETQAARAPRLLPKPELFQLPPEPVDFINQQHAVATITTVATRKREAGSGPAVCVISGKGGVGRRRWLSVSRI